MEILSPETEQALQEPGEDGEETMPMREKSKP